jgi:hypothetical protein
MAGKFYLAMANNHNAPTITRRNLEAQKAVLMRALESNETTMRGTITGHLRDVITQLEQLDRGTHFTQQQGDTLAKIVIDNFPSKKVIRQ